MSDQQLFFLKGVPLLQNRVFPTSEEAINCEQGILDIYWYEEAEIAVNRSFEPQRMIYDSAYNNEVPSPTFSRYYDDVIRLLGDWAALANGLVVDIGCGNGEFLRQFLREYSELRGLGVDPSFQGETERESSRLTFLVKHFESGQLREKPGLVVCRHTLEHIPDPGTFLRSVIEALRDFRSVPVYIEVPDLSWIAKNGAFWDFCYEHCNYFTPQGLQRLMGEVGFHHVTSTSLFGGQYFCCGGYTEERADAREFANQTVTELSTDLLLNPSQQVNAVLDSLAKVRAGYEQFVLWGMATKGIMLSIHLAQRGIGIDKAVDVNSAKQGWFTPVTGLEIVAPSGVKRQATTAVVCMNPNYFEEVREQCRVLGISGTVFIPGSGKQAEIAN